jgi:integrase/recombinase XerD
VNLTECVETYIRLKRDDGHPYINSGARLQAFARKTGDIALAAVKLCQVQEFIDTPGASSATRRFKYGLLRNFFLYCKGRYPLVTIPMPPNPPCAPSSTLIPHVYSRADIRALLSATAQTQRVSRCVIPARTYRAFLLFLYGTGALISEAHRALLQDVDLKRRMVTIRGGPFGRIRKIPIGFDLYRILSSYINFRNRQKGKKAVHLFIDKNGSPLVMGTVKVTFRRLRKAAGLTCGDNAMSPRMRDLRNSFAVHRLTAWYKAGLDLRTMAPALSAYMGQVGLTSTERYLRLTPERFRRELDILSPRYPHSRWRDDAALMKFLAQL